MKGEDTMKVIIAPVGTLGTNCYIVSSEQGSCFVVDPGAQPEKLAGILEEHHLTPKYILLTHGHHDHIGGVKGLMRKFPDAVLYIGENDKEMLEDATKSYANRWENGEDFRISGAQTLKEGDTLEVDELTIAVLDTPGHTKGGVCYLCGDVIFSGDTLFRGDIGRCDLYGGNFEVMKQSLAKLAALEGDYTVYPGHDASTTLDYERAYNPYLRG